MDTVQKAQPEKTEIKKPENSGTIMAAKMTKKSATAFRTISEVAEELEVQQHVLRFWETKFTQVKPLKRGGGRRYYRPEDVALLKKIHHLLYTEGYTIKGVQKLMKGQGKQQLIAEDVAEEKSVANESAVENRQVSSQKTVSTTEEGMSGKQRAILQAMLGDLKELRDMIKGK